MRPNVRIGIVAILVGSVTILSLYSLTIPAAEEKSSSVKSFRPSSSLPTSTFPSPPTSKKFTALTQKDVDGVEKFVFFIGNPRSGHSIIGSMMDAHPDMIIAHQYMLFGRWPRQGKLMMNKTYLFNALYKKSFSDAVKGLRSSMDKAGRKGYTLQMKNTWQGQFNQVKIIGDKSGGKSSLCYLDSPQRVQKSYRQLVDTVRIPVRAIHVIRNPYDMIATAALYHAGSAGHKLPASEKKFDNPKMLMAAAISQLKMAEGSKNFTESCNLTVLEVYSEDFIEDPKGTMKTVCEFLDLECWDKYLQQCYDKAYRSPSRTSTVVKWTPEVLEYINREMKHYPFFHRYMLSRTARP